VSVVRDLLHTITAQPIVYDAIQQLVGIQHSIDRLRPHLAETAGSTVLDVGAGTGLFFPAFPPSARYLWLDNDPKKLEGFRVRAPHAAAILGDGSNIGLADKSVDYATCIAIAHHLNDEQLDRFAGELSRVVRRKIFVIDPLYSDAWQSQLLWKYDRGSYPRTSEHLTSAIAQYFDIEHNDIYVVYHRYLLVVAQVR
jgi:ubiquinone/menaquinone biosynthesis C-methylase UbiE